MYDINIIHRDFYYIGGAERVAIAFIRYFQSFNEDVHLITRKIAPEFIETCRDHGVLSPRLKIVCLKNFMPLSKSIYSIFEDTFLLRHGNRCLTLKHRRPTIVVNTKFNEILMAGDICYIHYPTCIVLKNNPLDPSLLGPVLGKNYMASRFSSLYIRPFVETCYNLMTNELLKCKTVLFNSNFTLHVFKKYVDPSILQKIKDKIYVVHPPVDIVTKRVSERKVDNKKYILMRFKPLSSCPPEIWSSLITEIAKNFKEATIVVMGFAKSQIEWRYIMHLHRLAKELGLNNVSILVNATEEIKNLVFQKTKVYVHLIPYEHFGIMPLEALLHEANIVVHKMSGISYDVDLKEPHIMRYEMYPFDTEELLDLISVSYGSENPSSEIVQDIYNQFSFNRFRDIVDKIIKKEILTS